LVQGLREVVDFHEAVRGEGSRFYRSSTSGTAARAGLYAYAMNGR
jgi:hypothetical protein